ncbi:uncharacterized protein BJX67DRAFT_298286 [Aspergillus lucknowensis]|uniref:Uncharacterized protein n=1 Tax=Aspergillus lucknowensis TaxID=176173 RepID=A0ABR4LCS4_9EURO
MCTMLSSEEADDLLKPVHFSWDEEFDDVQESQTGSTPEPLGENAGVTLLDHEVNFLYPTNEFCTPGNEVMSNPLSIDTTTYSPYPGQLCTVEPEDDMSNLYYGAMDAAWREFAHRDRMLDAPGGNQIHHFNWEGCPVYERSSTPPEISLWYMTTQPKVYKPSCSSELRVETALRRSRTWIDPVLVHIKEGVDLPGHAETLIRFAKDKTYVFYSKHGRWQTEPQERMCFRDEGALETYFDKTVKVGNGFINGTPIRSREEWNTLKNQLQDFEFLRSRKRVLDERTEWIQNKRRKPSPLRHSTTIADTDADEVMTDVVNEPVNAAASPISMDPPPAFFYSPPNSEDTEMKDAETDEFIDEFTTQLSQEHLERDMEQALEANPMLAPICESPPPLTASSSSFGEDVLDSMDIDSETDMHSFSSMDNDSFGVVALDAAEL